MTPEQSDARITSELEQHWREWEERTDYLRAVLTLHASPGPMMVKMAVTILAEVRERQARREDE